MLSDYIDEADAEADEDNYTEQSSTQLELDMQDELDNELISGLATLLVRILSFIMPTPEWKRHIMTKMKIKSYTDCRGTVYSVGLRNFRVF